MCEDDAAVVSARICTLKGFTEGRSVLLKRQGVIGSGILGCVSYALHADVTWYFYCSC